MTSLPAHGRVLLIGMMGSGKSSVGTALGELLGWPFVDNDALVEAASGRTAREILRDAGQAALRRAEADAFLAGLELPAPVIVGVAGGVVLEVAHRERLRRGGTVVWLRASAEVLAVRAVGGEHRPWVDHDPLGWFSREVTEREPLYAEVADLEIDTGRAAPAAAADAIVAALTSRDCGSLPSAR